MLNLTGHYPLRAMIFPAQYVVDWPIHGKQIAEQAGLPAKYLSKILCDIVRAEMLEYSRGDWRRIPHEPPTRQDPPQGSAGPVLATGTTTMPVRQLGMRGRNPLPGTR